MKIQKFKGEEKAYLLAQNDFQICQMVTPPQGRSFFDTKTQTPYLVYNGSQWFSYDNQKSIGIKVPFVIRFKFSLRKFEIVYQIVSNVIK